MRGRRADRERLLDILEVIGQLSKHVTTRDQLDNPVVAAAAARWVEVIGEAAAAISTELREAHPEVRWRGPIDMRNRLIHGYYDIDPDKVWQTIQQEIPVLEGQVRDLLEGMPES